jgi:class 3 adenylate cyclase
MAAPSRSLAVLVAEVTGSSRLLEKLGDAEARRAIDRCLHRMQLAASSVKGGVVKTMENRLLAVFDSVEAAMNGATEMQRRIGALPPVSGVALTLRVGFHFGSVVEAGGEVLGETVGLATRLVDLAKVGQTLTTSDSAMRLPDAMRAYLRTVATITVRAKGGPLAVLEVVREPVEAPAIAPTETPVAPVTEPAPADGPRLRLRHGDKELLLGRERPTATLGRDASSDILTRDTRASRAHGLIKRRDDQFVLIDQSTNGTYVKFSGEPEFVLKRQETVLVGKGRISFGHTADGSPAEILEFEVIGGAT